MEEAFSILWYGIQIALGFHLVSPILFYLAYLLRKKGSADIRPVPADYAVIVTAYQYTDSLPAVVDSILKLNYQQYLVYIVADNCNSDELKFDDPRVTVLYPEKVLASNIGSHFYAIENFRRNHDRLTIIDSDNLVGPEYLNKLNILFDQGYQAVQGRRLPKNLDTTYACLDAARDIYYHFYDGKILSRLGSSATLSGSGMAFTVGLYRECLGGYTMEGAGFDKVLQAEIVKRDLRIAFAEDAIVYDAKTSRPAELVNQRSRWIGSWFRFYKLGFGLMGSGLLKSSPNQFLFGLILLRPPLFIFLLLSMLCLVANIGLGSAVAWIWTGGFALFVAGFGIALSQSATDGRIYRSLINIPKFMFLQVLALARFLLNSQTTVSTKHS